LIDEIVPAAQRSRLSLPRICGEIATFKLTADDVQAPNELAVTASSMSGRYNGCSNSTKFRSVQLCRAAIAIGDLENSVVGRMRALVIEGESAWTLLAVLCFVSRIEFANFAPARTSSQFARPCEPAPLLERSCWS
jgi:hypothetical protein